MGARFVTLSLKVVADDLDREIEAICRSLMNLESVWIVGRDRLAEDLYVVPVGDLNGGFTMHGPFNEEDAKSFAQKHWPSPAVKLKLPS